MTSTTHAPDRTRHRADQRPAQPVTGSVSPPVTAGATDAAAGVSSRGVIGGVSSPVIDATPGGVIDAVTAGAIDGLSVTETAVALAASGLPSGPGTVADAAQATVWAREGLARLGPDETWRRAWRTWRAGPAEAAALWPASGPSFACCTALALRIRPAALAPAAGHDGTGCSRRDRDFARRLGWPPSYAPPGTGPEAAPYYCAGDGS
jgi:hypothetical protein